jgi:BMFP domain-containing protein YqiC
METEMLSQKVFEEISGKLGQVLAESPAKDLEKNLRAMLQGAFSRLDLVTREEFEVQQAVLLRTREKLAAMEARIAALEQKGSGQAVGGASPSA